ncbi:hypothetical protein [Streptomyces paromomycinus]|uniref:Uncharacterized protein n=1 Tax=Streptomyces paromomycinus TaxID=92743 RepID=A0A401W7L1_STREY|nr:hypothetical protein [Streptomyces paromomycinus]GCD45299.1 hypothetical protein GKJPGBOP_05022 [Streptomyces paromomycinus]
MALTPDRPVPGPGFITGVVTSTWLDTTSPAGPVAWLLMAHPVPRRPGETAQGIENQLLCIAGELGLRTASQRMTVIGDRLSVHGPHLVLDYGHPRFALRVPSPSTRWLRHVLHGGHGCLALGLDPVPPGVGPDVIEAYLCRSVTRDRVFVGVTGVRAVRGTLGGRER